MPTDRKKQSVKFLLDMKELENAIQTSLESAYGPVDSLRVNPIKFKALFASKQLAREARLNSTMPLQISTTYQVNLLPTRRTSIHFLSPWENKERGKWVDLALEISNAFEKNLPGGRPLGVLRDRGYIVVHFRTGEERAKVLAAAQAPDFSLLISDEKVTMLYSGFPTKPKDNRKRKAEHKAQRKKREKKQTLEDLEREQRKTARKKEKNRLRKQARREGIPPTKTKEGASSVPKKILASKKRKLERRAMRESPFTREDFPVTRATSKRQKLKTPKGNQ